PADVEETAPGYWTLHLPPSSGLATYHEIVHPGLSDQARKHDVHCLNGDGARDLLSVELLPSPNNAAKTRVASLWATDERVNGADLYFLTRPPFRPEVIESVTTLLENLRINEEWLSDEPREPLVSSRSGDWGRSLQSELEALLKTIERPLLAQIGSSTTDPASYLALYAAEQR